MFFVIPILFTAILLGIMLVLFHSDLRNRMLEIGSGIPVLGSMLPEVPSLEAEMSETGLQAANWSKRIGELEALLSAKQSELELVVKDKTDQEQLIADLKGQIDQFKLLAEEKQFDADAYNANIQSLANMYAQITPSKAAPILQSMELAETVLILNAMRPEDRVRIMERMAPKTAADVTVMMKDHVPVKDQQIAALQARVKLLQASSPAAKSSASLDDTQLSATFSAMAPASAAELLLKMSEISQSKALRILNAVGSGPRSQILAEMSAQNDKLTAQLVSKLMTGK